MGVENEKVKLVEVSKFVAVLKSIDELHGWSFFSSVIVKDQRTRCRYQESLLFLAFPNNIVQAKSNKSLQEVSTTQDTFLTSALPAVQIAKRSQLQ